MKEKSNNLRIVLVVITCLIGFGLLTAQRLQAKAVASVVPEMVFSSYYGGGTEECLLYSCAVATDNAGNIYIAGTTRSDDFPLVNPYNTEFSLGGNEDVFVVKLAADSHTVLFSTYIAGGVAQGIAVDDIGNIYVTGWTNDDEFPTTNNAVQTTFQSIVDGFVFKLSGDGSDLLYSTFLGGTGRDEGFDLVVDRFYNIFVTGYTQSDDFVTLNAHQATSGGDNDVFVTVINNAGSLNYSTYLGGDRREEGWGIAIDDGGAAYVTGYSGSDNFPTTSGVVQTNRASASGTDAIMAKFSAVGALVYSTFFNETNTVAAVDMAVDNAGNSYMILTDKRVVSLNANATAVRYRTNLEISVNVGGEGGIVVDDDNKAYVVGWTGASLDKDIVFAVLDDGGQQLHYRTIGGSVEDNGHSIAFYEEANGDKRAYLVGFASSPDFPVQNPIQATLNGSRDLVVVEIQGLEDLEVNKLYLPILID